MRLRLFLSPLVLIARLVVSDVAFVYPPPFVSTTDFSSNIVMVEGEFKVIQWTNVSNPNNDRISVTMFQLNGTQFFGDAEYVTRESALYSCIKIIQYDLTQSILTYFPQETQRRIQYPPPGP